MPFRLIRGLFKTRSKAGSAAGTSAVTADDASSRDSPEAWLRQGEALEDADDISGALECYRACVRAYPGHLDARLALGNCLAAAWRTDECLAAFAEAVALAPDNSEVLSGLLLYAHYASSVDPRALFESHLNYARLTADLASRGGGRHPNTPDPERSLRIGYVSRNFSLHSVGYFIEPTIAAHDRRRNRIYCYHTHPKTDETTHRISRLADVWRHVYADNADALAERIRGDQIDVLVDLGGHTKLNHLPLFARRPAPVQMTWLGYPDTTGLPAIDYRITDRIADPAPIADTLHSERLLRLDPPFLCYRPPTDSPPVAARDDAPRLVFGSCNVFLKVNAPLIALWARILNAVPGSRLLLKSRLLQADAVVVQVLERFKAAGIASDRLDLRGWAPRRSDHLSVYHEIDIALDTYPYNGTTTTCEALWMGVPVVTLAGDVHMSRVGATVLTAVGLADLVASAPDEYVEKAVALARDPARRHTLRSTMRDRLATSPLLDHAAFSVKLEAVFREAWRIWCAGALERRSPEGSGPAYVL